jgi:hypothetical protein
MLTEMPLCLWIADVPAIVTGLSPELWHRLHDLVRPFVVNRFDVGLETEAVRIQVNDFADDRGGTRWIVHLQGEQICSHTRTDELIQYLEWLTISRAIAATDSYTVFHAAALTREAMTVMLAGPSGAGKSTLVLNLIQRGWLPLTDDIALVDTRTNAIHAFPRCFHVASEPAGYAVNRASFEWPAGLKGYARPMRWALSEHPATAIFLVERDTTGSSTCIPILQAYGAGALLSQAMRTRLSPSQTARAAARAAGSAQCYQLTNGDLEGALDLIAAPH